jgi:hypothetical protein
MAIGTKALTFQVHTKVDKPDPKGNRQQRRAAKKIVRKATK